MPIFGYNHPNIIKVIFNIPKFVTACKKTYFLSNRQLWLVLDEKSSQEYPVNTEVSQGSILCLTLFLRYINDLLDVICNVATYADDTSLCSKCDQASDLWQQLELASELESDTQDTHVDLGRKWLAGFNARKTQLVLFDWSNKTSAIYVKMDYRFFQAFFTAVICWQKLNLQLNFKITSSIFFISVTFHNNISLQLSKFYS